MHAQEGWFEKPIDRTIGIAPAGLNGCVLVFADNSAFGLSPQQQQEFNPKSGDLFTLYEDGTFFIRKPE